MRSPAAVQVAKRAVFFARQGLRSLLPSGSRLYGEADVLRPGVEARLLHVHSAGG